MIRKKSSDTVDSADERPSFDVVDVEGLRLAIAEAKDANWRSPLVSIAEGLLQKVRKEQRASQPVYSHGRKGNGEDH